MLATPFSSDSVKWVSLLLNCQFRRLLRLCRCRRNGEVEPEVSVSLEATQLARHCCNWSVVSLAVAIAIAIASNREMPLQSAAAGDR